MLTILLFISTISATDCEVGLIYDEERDKCATTADYCEYRGYIAEYYGGGECLCTANKYFYKRSESSTHYECLTARAICALNSNFMEGKPCQCQGEADWHFSKNECVCLDPLALYYVDGNGQASCIERDEYCKKIHNDNYLYDSSQQRCVTPEEYCYHRGREYASYNKETDECYCPSGTSEFLKKNGGYIVCSTLYEFCGSSDHEYTQEKGCYCPEGTKELTHNGLANPECLSYDKYCLRTLAGSVYDKATDSCKCVYPEIEQINNPELGWGSCIDAGIYCWKQLGNHSVYNYGEKICECDVGYYEHENHCFTIEEYCYAKMWGIYDEKTKQCTCKPNYYLNDEKDHRGNWVKRCVEKVEVSSSSITFIFLVILLSILF